MKNNWKEKYEKLTKEYTKVMEAYEHSRQENQMLQENYRPRVENDSNYEIIRRLDIIGNIVGRYIRDEELKKSKEKVDNAKKELEMLTYDYTSREMRYDNDYYYELKNNETSEWR